MGRIGLSLTISESLVQPFGGKQAMLGTNPTAIGIPSGQAPFIYDLATSLVSMGKIHHHALTQTPMAEGWPVDTNGRATTDTEAAKTGAIAPFEEAKGYGLGLALELLVSALAGTAFAPDVRGTLDAKNPANKEDVTMLIDQATKGGTGAQLAEYLYRPRISRPADPDRPVAVPADRMRARPAAALTQGIDLPDTLFEALRGLVPH
ncbi:hypothetical protein P775_02760 [Puniceibacterium antarcticum]|uniref:Uncharacterized protein n=2 Tax=Puniceibacterium antarcticum TaxID=1206336 RepID=A0A2G8RJS9_9RHOB|nr:Ldh family oxidoreductase [Puniceibacterium antarcticum]PIL21752.1 hypothetical protein P775_02760 [Puniceibacterium antarcticum]